MAIEMFWINVKFNSYLLSTACIQSPSTPAFRTYILLILEIYLNIVYMHSPAVKLHLKDFQQVKWPGSDFISSHCDVSTWCGSELHKQQCGSCPVIDLILTSNAPESSILRLDERSEIFHPPLQGQPNSQSTQICVSGQFVHLDYMCNWLYCTVI